MTWTRERIVIAMLAIALLAVAIMRLNKAIVAPATMDNPDGKVDVSVTTHNANPNEGPAYLTYNQPWAFSPPIGNFLPKMVAPGGVAVPVAGAISDDFGCSIC